MEKIITLTLTDGDVGQILDGLRARAHSWEQTALWLSRHENGHEINGESDIFLIEECSSVGEAEQIAQHYRDIIDTIKSQLKEQDV